MIKQKLYTSFLFFWLATFVLMAQTNTRVDLNAESRGRLQFNTRSELDNGKTQPNQVQVLIQNTRSWQREANYWKLTVRLANDFYNYNNYIEASWASLIFNYEINRSYNHRLINPSNVPVRLGKFNEVTLIESDVPLKPDTYRLFSYDLAVEGGPRLLTLPNGLYSTNYEFRIYTKARASDNYRLVSTATNISADINMNYEYNDGWYWGYPPKIELQNSANLVNLEFSTASDYTNGKSVYIPQGLKITSLNRHQVLVKTSNSVFTSASSSATIPVSKLKVDARLSSPKSNIALYGPLSLSNTDQVLINNNSNWNFLSWTTTYDLRFFVPPNTLQASDVQDGGTFSAFVYFIISPN